MTLKDRHLSVYIDFLAGNFTVKKTAHPFSALATDQVHEQTNTAMKGEGGPVGLTENPSALRQWMVCGQETAWIVEEFESSMDTKQKANVGHHEQNVHTQQAFYRDVKSLIDATEDMGSPFHNSSTDLLTLGSRDIADQAVTIH